MISAKTLRRIVLTGTVGYFVLALLARRLFRPIRLGSPVTGCRGLAERLMELVPDGTRNVTAFHLADGEVRFAGLGFDECTSVEIGSVTKVFTAQLLAESGIDPDSVAVRDLTFRELAEHTSGLPRMHATSWRHGVAWAFFGVNPDRRVGAGELLAAAENADLTGRGTQAYSNFGISVLGEVLARRHQMSYAELLRTRLCRPLGMTATGLGTADAQPRGVSVFGHEVAAYVDDGYAPCGAIRSTAADMAVFVRHLFAHGLPDYTWQSATSDGRDLWWHNGATTGFRSVLVLDPEREEAVFLATDSAAPGEGFERAALTLLGGG